MNASFRMRVDLNGSQPPLPNQPLHKLRGVRGIDDETWDDLGAAAEFQGLDRSAVVRMLVKWHLGQGELPERPQVITMDE